MDETRLFDSVDDWTKIDLENVKFILEEARMCEDYNLEMTDKITDKCFKILSLLFPIETALIAFIAKENLKKTMQDQTIDNLLLFCVIAIFIVMLLLGKIVLPRIFMSKGRRPSEITINKSLLTSDPKTNPSTLAITLNEIENYENKIQFNSVQNTKRITVLNYTMWALGVITIISIVTMFIHFYL